MRKLNIIVALIGFIAVIYLGYKLNRDIVCFSPSEITTIMSIFIGIMAYHIANYLYVGYKLDELADYKGLTDKAYEELDELKHPVKVDEATGSE